jgi:hypothetical protein
VPSIHVDSVADEHAPGSLDQCDPVRVQIGKTGIILQGGSRNIMGLSAGGILSHCDSAVNIARTDIVRDEKIGVAVLEFYPDVRTPETPVVDDPDIVGIINNDPRPETAIGIIAGHGSRGTIFYPNIGAWIVFQIVAVHNTAVGSIDVDAMFAVILQVVILKKIHRTAAQDPHPVPGVIIQRIILKNIQGITAVNEYSAHAVVIAYIELEKILIVTTLHFYSIPAVVSAYVI